ncbi:MAG: ribosome small subunit-dependent GTPase A [Krumholzibacteria bacterium]|nr:ribosome small subunit-dependent GTPase A [Candidatus Krumholzibacteria bacterium]
MNDTTEGVAPGTGLVIRAASGSCDVSAAGRLWRCDLRGRLTRGPREVQTPVVAGDQVRFSPVDARAEPPTGVVEEVLPRRNRVSRQASRRSGGRVEQVLMANLDQVVVVQSVREPAPQTGFVDRLLVAAERFGVGGVLVLNKADLARPADDPGRWDHYRTLGYTVLRTSVVSGAGLGELAAVLSRRISLLAGASGVGKSSLLNAIDPGLALRIGGITARTGLGRHTTTRTELFPVAGGGWIADSPGIRGFDPWDVDPLELRDFFPDLATAADTCRFRTCLHRDEPGCGVKAAVAAGLLPAWRHEAYLALLRDLEERRDRTGRR